MAQQGYEEDLLRQWFPVPTKDSGNPFTENDIRVIADALKRSSRERWSRIPRIYSVLKRIGQLHAVDAFVDDGTTDAAFTFSKNTMPEALQDHSARLQFLDLRHRATARLR
ncbi:uncharacterized protein K460DRAFT_403587 [Cucurbitaria berberidis CBS 394.84]|uniref:Uncharacterized protein n=1 Tax=Cucurbitaria berberidis CBS 394.84 TaxID=1168544 RepID=A0A9P4GMR6_9PLEO|nr:uncharacterized protein K460DRAFT_403587 [Cucurbitaria berberidis CBS 394.84]KAF1848294.1 hypothetical protein K460DRAFT_403587 [Cucurbitaria berberidis CBS 394.84]